jgi:hypothetical protein
MNEIELPYDIAAAGRDVQARYIEMIEANVPPRMAEMLALQSPPGVSGGDRAFMENRCNNQQLDAMPKDHAKRMVADAKKAGINISGKYYCSGLADKRGAGDPMAWVSGSDDVKKVAERRNLTVSGAVKHKGTAVPYKQGPALSERLTREMMAAEKHRKPAMKEVELREYVVNKYGRKKKK